MKTINVKRFYKNIILLKTEIFRRNSDEEYYDEDCINLFLATHRK